MEWEYGTAFLSEQGLSDVLLMVAADHTPVTPYDYHLNPSAGAITIVQE